MVDRSEREAMVVDVAASDLMSRLSELLESASRLRGG